MADEEKKIKGEYIYCVIDSSEEKDFGKIGIGGDGGQRVHSVCYEDVAAVVSDSPIKKYSISRESILTHQKVMETLMKDYTMLPVKYGTVAGEKEGVDAAQRIRSEVLKIRYEEIKDLLAKMENKTELGLKAIWIDMKKVFQEIVDENEKIKRMRKMIFSGRGTRYQKQKVTLGEEVKKALETKKTKEEKEIIAPLKRFYVDERSNKLFGDNMIFNYAFLVDKNHSEEFDNAISELDSTYNSRIKFKYIGPVPPINFVELVIILED